MPNAIHSPRFSQRCRWLLPVAIVLLGCLAYSNSLNGPFIFDDQVAIRDNPQVHTLLPTLKAPAIPQTIAGRPVAIFSFALNYAIAKNDVRLFHLTNVVIHLIAALLLFGVARRTLASPRLMNGSFEKTSPWLAATIAAIWIVHPLNTTAVTYLAQRVESLASMFILAAFYCLIRASTELSRRRIWTATCILSCALAMGTKEIAAATPVLALLYDSAFLSGSFTEALRRRRNLYLGLCATWVLIGWSLLTGGRGTMVGFHVGLSPVDYARTELDILARYLRLAICPTDLALDYDVWPMVQRWRDITAGGWFVLMLFIATLCACWKWPRLAFPWICFFSILAPTSSFLPIREEAAAEQRVYLPLAAFLCFVVPIAWLGLRPSRLGRMTGCTIAIAILCTGLFLTHIRNAQYADTEEMWRDNVEKRPDNLRARANLAAALAAKATQFPDGSPQAHLLTQEAAVQFQTVVDQWPDNMRAIMGLADSLQRLGDLNGAERIYSQTIDAFPDRTEVMLIERGNLRARRSAWNDARDDFKWAITMQPRDPEAHYFLALVDQQIGNFPESKHEFEITLQLSPGFKDAPQRLEIVQKK